MTTNYERLQAIVGKDVDLTYTTKDGTSVGTGGFVIELRRVEPAQSDELVPGTLVCMDDGMGWLIRDEDATLQIDDPPVGRTPLREPGDWCRADYPQFFQR